jgi:hypothetical protein
MIDLNCAGEVAALFCWMLNLVGPPPLAAAADQSELPKLLSILTPGADRILQEASLRPAAEIEHACRQIVLIRSLLQETRVPTAAAILRKANVGRLNEVELDAAENDMKCAADTLAHLAEDDRARMAGFYCIRDHAVLWFFSKRATFYG